MTDSHYDIIVIGSGPGGASLTHKLAPTGKRILLLERGDYLRRTPANWDSQTVFVDGAYQARELWYGRDGRSFHPGLHYFVGGNSKVYGAALVPHARAGLRGDRAPGWSLSGLAAEVRCLRALLRGSRTPVSCPRPAGGGSHRAAVERSISLPGRLP